MNITGLDLSLTATGFETGTHRGTIQTDPKHWDPKDATLRIRYICDQIRNIVALSDLPKTDIAVVEALLNTGAGGQAFDRAGLAFAVRLMLVDLQIPYVLIPPGTLKIFVTGRGNNVSKSDMRMALYKRYGLDIADDNEADAHALYRLGRAHYCGNDLDLDLPKTHLRALDKIVWP